MNQQIRSRPRPVVVRTPQERRALGRLRRSMEKSVEKLLSVLDDLAGDPDLEDGNDAEPEEDDANIGWSGSIRQQGRNWSGTALWWDDVEVEHDGREPDVDDEDGGDDEPSLGEGEAIMGRFAVERGSLWPGQEIRVDPGIDQTSWGQGRGFDDLEPEAPAL